MEFDPGSASNVADSLGADAISSYLSAPTNNGGPYFPFVPDNDTAGWNAYKNTGYQVIPWITTGRNAKPRIDNPGSWYSVCPTCWVADGTPGQIAAHVQTCLNWVQQNKAADSGNAIIMYAWNEHDEGGWICPTITVGNDSVANTEILDSIAVVLGNHLTTNDLWLTKRNDFILKTFPDPFNNALTIEFMPMEDCNVQLEIFTVTGQHLASLFDGKAGKGILNQFKYIPDTPYSGMIICRLATEYDILYSKAMMVK